MPESYLPFGESILFCRHGTIVEHRPSLLLIHGLGDSGLAFSEIFEDHRFDSFNVVVPDLVGYGRSSHPPASSGSFDAHLGDLSRVIDHFGLEQIILVGHSMGGDLGTLLCLLDRIRLKPKISRFLNVEGNLTEHDLFISELAVKADDAGRFDEWFAWHFTYRQVFGDWCPRWRFGRRYLASLQFCDPTSFLRDARELHRAGAEAGSRYRKVSIPKLFVFGQKSLRRETRKIALAGLDVYEITGSHHWPMIDYAEDFYGVLLRFCQGELAGGRIGKPAAGEENPTRRPVARVKVVPSVEYDDRSVRATLEESSIPWLIRQARETQDNLLWERYKNRPIRIADIGCGTGYHAEIYAPHCTFYHGYELSREMADEAQRRCAGLPNVEIIEGDAYDTVLRSKTYDVAWCLYFGAGNLRQTREILSDYDEAYLNENPRFIGIFARFYATLEAGGSLFLTIYKDTPQAEEAQRSFYWGTNQFVLTDFGSRFVATDKGFWSMRWTQECALSHLEKAGIDRVNITFIDLNEIAWLVEARK